MNTPYQAEELNDIVNACIEFNDNFPGEPFYEGNISGRQNVPPDPIAVKKKLKYISKLDIDVIIYLGPGIDNVEYFDLGPHASAFKREGGFKQHFKIKKREKFKNEILQWSPVGISVIALILSALAWLFPVNNEDKIQALEKQLDGIKIKQEQFEKAMIEPVKNQTDTLNPKKN